MNHELEVREVAAHIEAGCLRLLGDVRSPETGPALGLFQEPGPRRSSAGGSSNTFRRIES